MSLLKSLQSRPSSNPSVHEKPAQPISAFVDITPELAQEIWNTSHKASIELGVSNFRKFNLKRSDLMADAMAAGSWECNGESIKISTDDIVIDGQHRLAAIIKSQTTQKMLVVYNLSCSGVGVDRGQTRTIAQWLAHAGIPSASRVAASVRAILCYQKGDWDKPQLSNVPIIDSEIVDFAITNQDKVRDALSVVRQDNYYMLPHRVTIAYIASGDRLPSECPTICWFFDRLKDGLDLSETDAVYHLRKRHESQTAGQKMTNYLQRALLTEGWNRTAKGLDTSLRQLSFKMTGPQKQSCPTFIEQDTSIL